MRSALNSGGTESGFELAKVFGEFGCPGHLFPGLVGMLEDQSLRVQRLAGEVDGRVGLNLRALVWIIRAVPDNRESDVGCLDAQLMFAACFQLEPQFADYAFFASE